MVMKKGMVLRWQNKRVLSGHLRKKEILTVLRESLTAAYYETFKIRQIFTDLLKTEQLT
jgi:hypothetical protein